MAGRPIILRLTVSVRKVDLADAVAQDKTYRDKYDRCGVYGAVRSRGRKPQWLPDSRQCN